MAAVVSNSINFVSYATIGESGKPISYSVSKLIGQYLVKVLLVTTQDNY